MQNILKREKAKVTVTTDVGDRYIPVKDLYKPRKTPNNPNQHAQPAAAAGASPEPHAAHDDVDDPAQLPSRQHVEDYVGPLPVSDDDEEPAEEEPLPSSAARPTPLDGVREQLQWQHLQQLLPNQQLHNQLCKAELQVYQQHTAAGFHTCCPHCMCFTQHRSVLGSGPAELAPRMTNSAYRVYLCTQLAIHELDVWPVQCAACQDVHCPGPLQLGCFPGTANAFTLQRRSDVVPVWFSMDLLQHLDTAMYVERDQSIFKYVAARQPGWLISQQVEGLKEAAAADALILPDLPASYNQQQLPLSADTLRRQLGDALREYIFALSRLATLPESLEGWPTGVDNPCAACSPQRLQLHFDLCFKLEMLKRAGYHLQYQQPPNNRRFVSNSSTIAELEAIDADLQRQQKLVPASAAAAAAVPARVPALPEPAVGEEGGDTPGSASAQADGSSNTGAPEKDCSSCQGDSCSRFTADKLVPSAPKGRLITAVGVSACRHGFVYHAINCLDAGERHAYAILAFKLMLVSSCMMHVWWYDINCRWMPSLLRWLQQQEADVRNKAEGTWLPVPPWHLLAHMVSCRVKHGHVHMPGVGTGTGEVCERVNAVLGPHGKITRYMNGTNREARLERVLLLLERDLDAKLPAVLVEMLVRAHKGKVTTQGKLEATLQDLSKLFAAQFPEEADRQQQIAALVVAAGQRLMEPAKRLAMGWQGDYVKAWLMMEAAGSRRDPETDNTAMTAPVSLLFSKQAASGFKVTKAAVQQAKRTLGTIGAQHFPAGLAPNLANPQLMEGLHQLVMVTISNAVEDLLVLLTQARYAEWVVQRLLGRPAAVRRALKRKQTLWQQVVAAHDQLKEWVEWALQLQQKHVVEQWQPAFAAQLKNLQETQLKDLGSTPGGVGVVTGGSAADKVALQVYLLRCELQHEEEEIELVMQERSNLVEVLETRQQVLLAALADDAQANGGSGGGGSTGGGGSSSSGSSSAADEGHALGKRMVMLLELRRTQQTLEVARKVGAMTPAEEAAQLADALELMPNE